MEDSSLGGFCLPGSDPLLALAFWVGDVLIPGSFPDLKCVPPRPSPPPSSSPTPGPLGGRPRVQGTREGRPVLGPTPQGASCRGASVALRGAFSCSGGGFSCSGRRPVADGLAEQLKACGAQLSGWVGFPRVGGASPGLSCSGSVFQLLRVEFQLLRRGGPWGWVFRQVHLFENM